MKSLKKILDRIGDFSCYISDELACFSGILNGEKGNIVLRSKMKIEWYQKIDPYSSINMWGDVNGIPVSFLRVYLKGSSHRNEETTISLTFVPSEIIIGQSSSAEIQVTRMRMSISALNYMFPTLPSHSFSEDNAPVPNYMVSHAIEADDKYGHLRLYQTVGKEWTYDAVSYKFSPIIEYQFRNPLKIMDAVAKIAAVRSLFTFFANHYLPLENITFESAESKSAENSIPRTCTLYLNGGEDLPVPQEPFLLTTAAFSEKFGLVWNRWLQIYEEAMYIPTLFYEIICNRSTRINRFLNLSQTIEIYSRRYRKEAVVEVARMRERTRAERKPPIHLNHRFEDVFTLLNPYLEIAKSGIPVISKSLADMRNFFTHYDETKYAEPSYQEMTAACHILEFVLLAIIYHEVGIPDECIRSSRKRIQFQRFDEFVEMLTKDYRPQKQREPAHDS